MKSRAEELEEWGTDVIFGRARGFRAWAMRGILRVGSWFFRGLVGARLFLFRRRLKTVHYLGTLTVSVGNITAGGTGKTPVVELLARTLAARGRKCAILTRGYKASPCATRRYGWTRMAAACAASPRLRATAPTASSTRTMPGTSRSCWRATWTAWPCWWTRTA